MNLFLRPAFLFFLGSLFGWVLELFYRRIVHKRWINPGFLKGPYLPIYGLGLVFMYLICLIDFSFIPVSFWRHAIRILFIGVVMTGIEYVGGIIFIKGMKIKLWDYSMRRGNLQGVICPLFSLIWTAVGALYCYLLNPWILSIVGWFDDNIGFSFFVGIFFGVFFVDLAASLRLSVKLRSFAVKYRIVIRYENLKEEIKEQMSLAKQKYRFSNFFDPLKGDLRESLLKHKEDLQSRIGKRK